MQAQAMKDEVQEAQPLDSAAQKSVTDWLMHVISGKQQPAEEPLRTAAQGAPKMEPLVNMTAPAMPKEMNGTAAAETNGSAPETWTGLFTAEDLCGAPVIPLPPRVEEPEPAKDEISADDVCWVPEDRRLKPEPMIITRPEAAAPPQAQMATVLDITRDPAPHFSGESAARAFALEKEITVADISRQWVIDEMEQTNAAVAEPEPEPIAEPVPEPYAAQVLSVAAPEVIAEPEPVAHFAAEPIAAIEPEPIAAIEPEPVVAVAEPMAFSTDVFAERPAPAPVMDSAVADVFADRPAPAPVMESAVAPEPIVAPEPQIDVAPFAYAEPVAYEQSVAYAEPEPVVAEADVVEAGQTAAMHGEVMPEIVHESPTYADHEEQPTVAEPVAHADEKVWAKEGYWEGVRRGVHDSEQRILEGKITEGKIAEGEIEKGLGKPQQPADHGYFGSYLGPEEVEEIEKAKPEGWSQSWRTLIRLGSALPWLSRALPALEAGMGSQAGPPAGPGAAQGMGGGATAGASAEMQQDVAGMRLVQYEIRTTVQDHSAHLKRMEEQLTRVRESVESKAANQELAENVQSAMKMLKMVGIGLGGLLVLLIVLAVVMIMKH